MQMTDKQKKWGVDHWRSAGCDPLRACLCGSRPAGSFSACPRRDSETLACPAYAGSTDTQSSHPSGAGERDVLALIGVWSGTGIRQDGTLCGTRLELQATPGKPGDYTGYTTRTCGPVPFSTGHITGKSLPAALIRK